MSHVSVKVKLEGGQFPVSNLADWFGFVADGPEERHSDSIYRLAGGRLLKIRDYPHRPADIILEHVTSEGGMRHSKISVGLMREGPRDSSPQEVLGAAALTIGKRRRVFTIEEYPAIKLYADELSNSARFLEFQMDIGKRDARAAVRELKKIVASYGFGEDDLVEQSYESLYAGNLFKEASDYTEAYAYLPEDVQAEIRQCARVKLKGGQILLEKGSEGQTALLISKGRAYIHEYGVTLRPGQLVGEFAAFTNGRRTAEVVPSSDFEGYVLQRPLLMRLMTDIPANAEKFLKWSQSQAAHAPAAP